MAIPEVAQVAVAMEDLIHSNICLDNSDDNNSSDSGAQH